LIEADAAHAATLAAAEHLQGASLERATRLEASAGEHAEAIRLATIDRSSAVRQAAAVFDQAVEEAISAGAAALRDVSAEQDEALRRDQRTYDRSLLPGGALGTLAIPAARTGAEGESVEARPPGPAVAARVNGSEEYRPELEPAATAGNHRAG